MKPPTNLHHVDDADLINLLHKIKKGILLAADHGTAASESFHISVTILQIYERELRERGYDPTDVETFGVDIIGKLIELKLEEANAGPEEVEENEENARV